MEFMRRFGTLALAGLFILTSVAFTAVLLWSSRNESNNSDLTLEQQQMIQEQLNQANNQDTGENMARLEGTLLAGFTPITTPVTDLQVIDIVEGTGAVVPEGATITAHYTGAYVVNGQIFQSSKDMGQPYQFSLNGVIAGWTQGVPGMKVGGQRRLIIPGNLAYGEAPEGYVPGSGGSPMGPLVFDIELVSID